jgi:hypothetical protein
MKDPGGVAPGNGQTPRRWSGSIARRRTRSAAVLPQGGRHAAHTAAESMAESINVTAEDSLRRL